MVFLGKINKRSFIKGSKKTKWSVYPVEKLLLANWNPNLLCKKEIFLE